MTTLFSYLLTFLAIIFWAFRAVVTLMYQLDNPLFSTPSNVNYEIIVLFLTLPCLIGVCKRNAVCAAGYLALYASYFGSTLYKVVTACGPLMSSLESVSETRTDLTAYITDQLNNGVYKTKTSKVEVVNEITDKIKESSSFVLFSSKNLRFTKFS